MTPLWALGYQQSRWGYSSDAEVREIGRRLRADRIPADVIWMDIDYQDRYRPFTVDKTKFPDLRKLNTRPERRRHPARRDHRPPHRLRAEPGLCAARGRASPAITSSAKPTARFTSRRCGRALRSFPISPARRAAMVGQSLQGFHRRRLRRLLERHERAGGVRDADQDHADRQSPPGRQRRFRAARCDPCRDPQRLRDAEHARHVRGNAAAAARRAARS